MILRSQGSAGFDTDAVKFGRGLFETMLFKENRIVFLSEHIKRLFQSSEILDIGQNQIAKLISDVLSLEDISPSDCIIRMSLYDCGYSIETRELLYDEDSYKRGFRLCRYPYRRGESPLFRHKTTSYLSNLHAKQYAAKRGFNDALIFGLNEEVLECSYSNIFCRKGDQFFFVKDTSSFLEGISSQNIIKVLQNSGFDIIKKDMDMDFLKSADNVFISNSAMNMMSVGAIDEKVFKKDTDICLEVNRLLLEMNRKNNVQSKYCNFSLASTDRGENHKELNIDTVMEYIKEKYKLDNRFLFVFLTGSSRDLLFEKDKDIDIFIIDEMSDIQIRDTVILNGYELDINIMSEKLVSELLDKDEAFMIKAFRNSTYIDGNYNIYRNYKMKVC